MEQQNTLQGSDWWEESINDSRCKLEERQKARKEQAQLWRNLDEREKEYLECEAKRERLKRKKEMNDKLRKERIRIYIRIEIPCIFLNNICNQHEYDTMNIVMTLFKPLNNPNMLTPYEQFHIQALHQKGKLIPEYAGDPNPLFQLAIHPPIRLDKTSRAASLFVDAHPSALHLTPTASSQCTYGFIFNSIIYVIPTQPQATL